jgi:choline-sulfatase
LPSFRELMESKERRFHAALFGPQICLVWFVSGEVSLGLFSAFPQSPAALGVLLSASVLCLYLASTAAAFWLSRVLSKKFEAPGSALVLAFALGCPALFLPVTVLAGTTSGTGSIGALFGTLRRAELDLSPALQLGALFGCAWLGAHGARRLPQSSSVILLLAPLLMSALGLRSASSLSFREAVTLERSSGLTRGSLRIARSSTDADGDGFSSRFGGGDCDDRSARVHPLALDIPGNGIDDDCRGGDRKPQKEQEQKAQSPASAPEVPQKANVLLLTVDTMRWDVGYSGKSRAGLTPELDALAQRSTIFERAHSLASYTSKSLGPMLIGKYPSETKRTFEHFDRFSPDVPFLQQRLKNAGIYTVSVQGYWYFFFKGYGFERGFDLLDSSAAPKAVAIEGDRTSNGDEVAERTIEQLGALAKSGRQFLLWSHWVDPHAEYVPHEQFDFGSEARARYDGEIAFVDQQIGKVLMALSKHGLDKTTIVIVTSDHGEAFGEHGMIRHGFEVWEELVRVPLLVHVPGAKPQRILARRSLIDVMPTVLDVFSVPLPSGESASGYSLLRDVFAADATRVESRPVLVDMPEGPHNRERRAFYDGDLKLITSGGQVLGLYDLAKDPGEKRDLSNDQGLLLPIQKRMNEFLDRLTQVPATR